MPNSVCTLAFWLLAIVAHVSFAEVSSIPNCIAFSGSYSKLLIAPLHKTYHNSRHCRDFSMVRASSNSNHGYYFLDSGGSKRLEIFGSRIVVRPCPSAVWAPGLESDDWLNADCEFFIPKKPPDQGGKGEWTCNVDKSAEWALEFPELGISFDLSTSVNGQVLQRL